MSRTVVVALGGNALSPSGEPATVANQFRHTRESLEPVVRFACQGRKVAIVHGNGPQVGDELRRGELASAEVEPLPLGVLVAATAGWIGYMIQQSLHNALRRAGSPRRVVSLITQVRVDPDDPALRRPTKFVGREVSAENRAGVEAEGYRVGEDDRGRLRRRVASPRPVEIVEAPMVAELVGRGDIVVAAGGGGVPVYCDEHRNWEGLDVVVDKDRAAALLATRMEAAELLILTDVDAVYRGFGTADARPLARLSAGEAERLVREDELGEGSMRPKVEAAVSFLEGGGRRAVIAHLREADRALDGAAGTEILAD